MIMALLLTVLTVLVILIGNEWWWRTRVVHGELSRKFVHITVGSFVAIWPWFLSWQEIRLLSLAFVAAVLISKALNIFQAIHSVQRPTWGEVFFAVAVGFITLLTSNPWVFAVAILLMSLADGLAAVVGTRYGMKHRYLVLGSPKTLVGTLTFFVVSAIILFIFNHKVPAELDIPTILALSFGASVIENVGVQGLDNLLVPVLAVIVLTAA